MRIAMVGPFGLHPNKTMRSRALNLARPLAQRGHDVCILMPPWQRPAEADRRWQEDGVSLRYTPLGGGVPGRAWRLLRETLAWQPDVVHTFKPKAYSGLVAWWLWQFRRGRLPLVTDTDDWEGRGGWNERGDYSPWQKRFFAWQEHWGLSHGHALTVASRTLQSLAWSQGRPPAAVHYLPNGPGIPRGEARAAAARRQQLGLGRRPLLLLYSRLFEFDSGRLVAILQRVRASQPALALLLVGASLHEEDATRFRQRLAAAGLAEIVVDTGWAEEGELPALLAAADVGLYLMDDTLLNRAKCPVKLADMLHAGLPVVAEGVGQVTEYVVSGRTGLVRPSGDEAGLAADITSLLQDEPTRRRLGRQAQAHIDAEFSWQILADRLLAVYENVTRNA